MEPKRYLLTLAREPKSTGGVRYENAELGQNGKPFAIYLPQALARAYGANGAYAPTIALALEPGETFTIDRPKADKVRRVK